MSVLLTTAQLAERWHCSLKKLEADRLRGGGCPYIKIGALVRYRAEDIDAYEIQRARSSTSEVRR